MTIEQTDKLIRLWSTFYTVYKGISVSQATKDLNQEFINYFGCVIAPIEMRGSNQPVYYDCFRIKNTIYTIRWSLTSSESKIKYLNLGREMFDIDICVVHPEEFTHVRSSHLLKFIIDNIPNEGIYILEKLIYDKI